MENNKIKILVVDDDEAINTAISKLLTLEGYQVCSAYHGLQALDILVTTPVQLIIMDIMMPKMDGMSATLKIRQQHNIPIIMLSAKSEDSDKIIGLTMGADDYLTKPFNPQELLARVKSQLRRYMALGNQQSSTTNRLQNGRLTLDLDAKQLLVDNEETKLTATEYKIVELLMKNLGMVFNAERIYELVWNETSYAVENTVMVHIRRIREKIEINPRQPEYLKVVWGIGYKMERYHEKTSN